jgi:hypothetical protein
VAGPDAFGIGLFIFGKPPGVTFVPEETVGVSVLLKTLAGISGVIRPGGIFSCVCRGSGGMDGFVVA